MVGEAGDNAAAEVGDSTTPSWLLITKGDSASARCSPSATDSGGAGCTDAELLATGSPGTVRFGGDANVVRDAIRNS